MGKRILVCYVSLAGSTAEVAQAVADTLAQAGADVTVRLAREVRPADLNGCSAVVLGTAIRMDKVAGDAVSFVRRHLEALGPLPVAYFTVGLEMRLGTWEALQETIGYLAPLRALKEPVATGHFAGVMSWKKLAAPLRFLASHGNDPRFVEGDWRDWDAIRTWAGNLAPVLGIAPEAGH